MRAFVVVPPAPVLSYEEAVARLRLNGGEDERADVEGMIAAATRTVDGPAGWLGRCLGPQTIEARFDDWCGGALRLPYPPVIEIVSVTYVDEGGVVQVLPPAACELFGDTLEPAFGASWATPRTRREAVRIRYRAGYDPEDPVNATAVAGIKAAILLIVGDLYQRRTTTVDSVSTAVPMSAPVERLLPPRVFY